MKDVNYIIINQCKQETISPVPIENMYTVGSMTSVTNWDMSFEEAQGFAVS